MASRKPTPKPDQKEENNSTTMASEKKVPRDNDATGHTPEKKHRAHSVCSFGKTGANDKPNDPKLSAKGKEQNSSSSGAAKLISNTSVVVADASAKSDNGTQSHKSSSSKKTQSSNLRSSNSKKLQSSNSVSHKSHSSV